MRRSSFRRGNLGRLGALVNSSLDKLGLRRKVQECQALGKWKQVVGPQIGAASAAENVRDGILFVCCRSSMWASELSLHKTDIMRRLNKAVGTEVIKDIRFSARGFNRAMQAGQKEETPNRGKSVETVPVDQEDSDVASQVASLSPSEELAEKIEKAVITGKRLTKLKDEEGWKSCLKCSASHNSPSDFCDNCR